MALAAPVDVGIIDTAAARARRRSLWGRSRIFWSLVYECTVVIWPFTMPNRSCSTRATGPRQFVVQEALETTWWLLGSYLLWLTPITIVMSSPLAGAEMMTFRAPAVRCAFALSPSVNRPVDSTAYSTPRPFHGSWAGSLTARTLMLRPATWRVSPSVRTSSGRFPRIESYLSRWASVGASVMSL